MARRDYLNFDLELASGEDGSHFTARVLDSPAGEAANDFEMPFTDQDLEIFTLKVGRTRTGKRRYGSPETEMARTFGTTLYESVFAGEVRTALRRAIDAAEREGRGLRIRLRVSGAPKLNDVPWEYMYSPGLARFLVLSSETPIVRYIDLPNRPTPLSITGPLRILMIVSSPTDVEPLDVEREVAMLREATADLAERGLIELDVLETATLQALQRKLRTGTYHVLHFIGHGGFDSRTEDGLLVFEDANQRAYPVTGHDLGMLLHDHDSLRLVILNACEGSRTSPNDPFAGVSQSLVRQGMPAVVGMQFEITDAAAIAFSHELYSAIVDGYPIDAATADARKLIFASGNDIEWGTPVLHMRTTDGVIFDTSALEAAPRKPIPAPPQVERVDETRSASGPAEEQLPSAEEQPDLPEPPGQAEPTQPMAPVGFLDTTAQTAPTEPGPAPVPATAFAPTLPADTPSPPQPPTAPSRSGFPGGRAGLIGVAAVAVAAVVGVVMSLGGGEDDGTEVAGVTLTTAAVVQDTAAQQEPDARDGEGDTQGGFAEADTALVAIPLSDIEVTIDGFRDEWPDPAPYVLADNTVAGEVDEDFYADWQLGWDDQYLYANVYVEDWDVEQTHESDPDQLWKGDSIHFEIGRYDPELGADDGLRPGDLHVLLGPVPLGGSDCEMITAANPAIDGTFQAGGAVAGTETACFIFEPADGEDLAGYNVEFAIPWSSLGLAPSPGDVFSMNLNASDSFEGDLWSMVSTNPDRSASHQALPGWWDQVTLLP